MIIGSDVLVVVNITAPGKEVQRSLKMYPKNQDSTRQKVREISNLFLKQVHFSANGISILHSFLVE